MYGLRSTPILVLIGLMTVALLARAHDQAVNPNPSALRVRADNAAELLPGGMDAQGGIGDWFVSNGTICAIVSDPSQESVLTPQGGVLTDIGFCGRGDDHFLALYPAVNLDLRSPMQFDQVQTVVDKGVAQVITTGERDGLQVSVAYRARQAHPRSLLIETEIVRLRPGTRLQRYGVVLLTAHSMPIYDVSEDRRSESSGFAHVEGEPGAADLTVLLGRGDPGREIVYGYHQLGSVVVRPDGEREPLALLDTAGHEYATSFAILDDDLEVGGKLIQRGELLLEPGVAVSLITDRVWSNGPLVKVGTGEADVVLLVEDARGQPITHAISGEGGDAAFRVPGKGDYRLAAHADGREAVTVAFAVESELVELPPIELAEPARLRLPAGGVMRLSFSRLDVPRDPNFIDPHFDHVVRVGDRVRADGESRYLFLSGDATDERVATLAPGTYRITASRGPEFSVEQVTLVLRAGEETMLDLAAPVRVLTTPGYLSADFHVHSGHSFDNNLGIVPRLKSYVAQGAEVLVATEHDTIFDFSAAIAAMGLEDRLRTLAGTELTTELGNSRAPFGIGHANIFPLDPEPLLPRRGAPPHERHRWRDIFKGLHALEEMPLAQLNHPRGSEAGGVSVGEYFTHMAVAGVAFDRHLPLTSPPNSVMVEVDAASGLRDIDFDLIEIENGNRWGARYRATRDDWFSLLRQGVRMVAAANSDSHGVSNGDLAANVRNMVHTGSDDLARFDERAFLAAIARGDLYGTNGPLLALTLSGARMGETAAGPGAELVLRVDAAKWMRVDRYSVYVNGVPSREGTVTVGEEIAIPITASEDAFVTVEVTGPVTDLSKEVIGDVPPFAFSNPIYLDVDGDGKWTPVGTPLPKP